MTSDKQKVKEETNSIVGRAYAQSRGATNAKSEEPSALPKPILRGAGKPHAAVPVTNGRTSAGAAILGDVTASPNPTRTTDGALNSAAEIMWPKISPAAHNRNLLEPGPDGTYAWRNQADGCFE